MRFHFLFTDVQVQTALEGCYPISKAEKAPFTLDSTSRFEYQPPCLHENLKNNTLRYGCNTRKNVPALGAGKALFYLHKAWKTLIDPTQLSVCY